MDAVTTPSPSLPPEPPKPPQSLAQALGVNRPQPCVVGWPPDGQLLLAMAVALPAWLLLGLTMGPAMYLPVTLWAWASLVLVQPLLEELVFRGLLQGQALTLLVRGGSPIRLGPLTLANVLVTVAFVALHLRAQPLAWALAVAVPSLVFGHLRERFNSVWPAVGLHAFYNAGFGLTAWLVATG
jgi:membrane protease YdiL (CAAX protease family)